MHRFLLTVVLYVFGWHAVSAQPSPIVLTIQDDEARAAIAILDTLAVHAEPSAALWNALWTSDGYRRLKRREAAMQRAFTDSSFAAFLRADTIVARRVQLRETLRAWRNKDSNASARQALAWLPADARLKATVYLLVKPRPNSFVFETTTDPAIMLYLEPGKPAAQYTNIVTHELHHIGWASVCHTGSPAITDRVGQARAYLGAFGEGMAMLAAAGSADTHPHEVSNAEDRARWDHEVRNFDQDRKAVEDFVRGVLDGQIVGDSIAARGSAFFGTQGPWYTVGWKMSAVITRENGRDKLLAVMCDPVDFLRAFNEAVPMHQRRTGERLATWDAALLDRLRR